MVTTDNCCMCFSLRTGCLIIGWVQFVFPSLGLINSIVLKVQNIPAAEENPIDNAVTNANTFWGDIFISTLQVILALSLLYGVYTNRKRFVYYYLFAETAIIVLRISLVILYLIFASYENIGIVISVNVVVLLILAYMMVVVYSYHQDMVSN